MLPNNNNEIRKLYYEYLIRKLYLQIKFTKSKNTWSINCLNHVILLCKYYLWLIIYDYDCLYHSIIKIGDVLLST